MDEFVDFWAVGVMLYEMVRAVRPFQAEDTRRLERLILSRQSAPSLNGSRPAALESIIAKLSAPTPAERYPNVKAIREDLDISNLVRRPRPRRRVGRIAPLTNRKLDGHNCPSTLTRKRHGARQNRKSRARSRLPRIRSGNGFPRMCFELLASCWSSECSLSSLMSSGFDRTRIGLPRSCRRERSSNWVICGINTTTFPDGTISGSQPSDT